MKKYILFLIIGLTPAISFSQSELEKNNNSEINQLVFTYRLFPTDNMWTFIKLNTRNGKMWQVQYSMDDNRFESSLSLINLVEKNEEIDNRFTLYKTQNTWTFILLDQIDGRTWQVQWSMDYENRGIIPID
ncbi:hypothetical protein ACU8DI_14805 [Psychroserpens sp. BH13MA-6]